MYRLFWQNEKLNALKYNAMIFPFINRRMYEMDFGREYQADSDASTCTVQDTVRYF